jgi:outer membrane protein assembly factor BamE (lipoprotein component of BamABCDE complex)
MLLKRENFRMSSVAALSLIIGLFFCLSTATFAQTETIARSEVKKSAEQEKAQAVLQPATANLKGITVGMTADEVKDKLGKAKFTDATGFYYVFSDDETMQVTLDADKKVQMIAAIYMGDEAKAPKYEDVFGAGAAVEAQPDGKIYKLVNYPDAGYWVAYSRVMVGDEPTTTVTMQKIQ